MKKSANKTKKRVRFNRSPSKAEQEAEKAITNKTKKRVRFMSPKIQKAAR